MKTLLLWLVILVAWSIALLLQLLGSGWWNLIFCCALVLTLLGSTLHTIFLKLKQENNVILIRFFQRRYFSTFYRNYFFATTLNQDRWGCNLWTPKQNHGDDGFVETTWGSDLANQNHDFWDFKILFILLLNSTDRALFKFFLFVKW